MKDTEVLCKLTTNLVKFLTPLVPIDQFQMFLEWRSWAEKSPLELKQFVIRNLKPYELDLDHSISALITTVKMKREDFKQSDLDKFKRFLKAMCECV